VILDMQNQLLQVKTAVAIAIAEQHALEKSQKDNANKHAEWTRKRSCRGQGKDDLARAALERAVSCQRMMENFEHQVADQKTQVENLKTILRKLSRNWRRRRRGAVAGVAAPAFAALSRPATRNAHADSSHGNEFLALANKVNRARRSASQGGNAGRQRRGAIDGARSQRPVELLLAEIKAKAEQSVAVRSRLPRRTARRGRRERQMCLMLYIAAASPIARWIRASFVEGSRRNGRGRASVVLAAACDVRSVEGGCSCGFPYVRAILQSLTPKGCLRTTRIARTR